MSRPEDVLAEYGFIQGPPNPEDQEGLGPEFLNLLIKSGHLKPFEQPIQVPPPAPGPVQMPGPGAVRAQQMLQQAQQQQMAAVGPPVPKGFATMGAPTPAEQQFAQGPGPMWAAQTAPPIPKEIAGIFKDPKVNYYAELLVPRLPMALMAGTGYYAIPVIYEAINQIKNVAVSLAQRSKYDPLASRQLSELIPEKAPDWLKEISSGTEGIADMIISAIAAKEISEPIFRKNLDMIFTKAEKAGWPKEVIDRYRYVLEQTGPRGLEREISSLLKTPGQGFPGPPPMAPGEIQQPVAPETPPPAQKTPTQRAIQPIIPGPTAPAQAPVGQMVPPVMPTPPVQPIPQPIPTPAPVTPAAMPQPVVPAPTKAVGPSPLKVGDVVYLNGKPVTVVDTSDPSLLTVRTETGATPTTGRNSVLREPPTAPITPTTTVGQEPEAEKILKTQTEILRATGKPEDQIGKFIADELADGEELRRITTDVVGGKRTMADATKEVSGLIDNAVEPTPKPEPQKKTIARLLNEYKQLPKVSRSQESFDVQKAKWEELLTAYQEIIRLKAPVYGLADITPEELRSAALDVANSAISLNQREAEITMNAQLRKYIPDGRVAAKEPWEITRDQFIQAHAIKGTRRSEYQTGAQHSAAVLEALKAGKDVPEDVLADYPDLVKRIKEPKPEIPPSVGEKVESVSEAIKEEGAKELKIVREGDSRIKRTDYAKQKEWLIGKITKSIDEAPEEWDKDSKIPEFVLFDVPGDGNFKVTNRKKELGAFRKIVASKFPGSKPALVTAKGTMPSKKPMPAGQLSELLKEDIAAAKAAGGQQTIPLAEGAKVGNPNKGFDFKYLTTRLDMISSVKGGYLTDGHMAIFDKEVTDKLFNEWKAKELKKSEDWAINHGVPVGQMLEKEEADIAERIQEGKMDKTVENIMPDKVAPYIGDLKEVTRIGDNDIPAVVLSDGKTEVYLNPDKYSFLRKHFPNAHFRFTAPDEMVQVVENDKIKAVLMPIAGGNKPAPGAKPVMSDVTSLESTSDIKKDLLNYVKKAKAYRDNLQGKEHGLAEGELSALAVSLKKFNKEFKDFGPEHRNWVGSPAQLAKKIAKKEQGLGVGEQFSDEELGRMIEEAVTPGPKETVEQAIEGVKKEIEEKEPPEGPPVGLSVRAVGQAPTRETFTFEDPAVEERFQGAKGIPVERATDKAIESMRSLWHQVSRTYEHLPNTKEFAEGKQALKILAKQKGVALDKAVLFLRDIQLELDKGSQDLFSRKVLLDDLAAEAEEDHELPFGFTKDSLKAEKERLDDRVSENPKISAAMARRKRVMDAVVGDLVKAARDIGFNIEDRFKKSAYYRHQVLQYAEAKGIAGTGRRLRTPSSRGFLKQRKGSEYDINMDYNEADFEVLSQMLYDREVMKTLGTIEKNFNIKNQLKVQAMHQNNENIMGFFEQMAEDQNAQNAAVEALGGKHMPEVSAEKLYRAKLNWKQAKGFADLAKVAAEGQLPDTPDGKYQDIIEKLAESKDALDDAVEHWKELDKEERIEQGRPSLSLDFEPEEMKQLFDYMGWILKEHNKGPGAPESALVFKGIRQKKEFIKEKLGKEYVTWEDMIPEGHVKWQPREGHVFYFAETLPEKLARMITEGAVKEVSGEDLKKAMVVGQERTAWVIPEELAQTLDELSPPTPKWLDRTAKSGLKAWKVYILTAPQRVLKYNIRNLTGDAEAVFVGNPSAFKKVPLAIKELYDLYILRKPMSTEMQEWFNRGGMESTLQAQELQDLKHLRLFQRFYDQKTGALKVPEKVFKQYWRVARLSTDFREAILRYAAYRDYLDQVNKNPQALPKNYGASLRQEIQGLSDPRDRAFRLSNDLLGAYDEISVFGQWLREHAIPFWSWKELNFRRYMRFVKNAALDAKAATKAGERFGPWAKMGGYSAYKFGKIMIRMAGLWAMLQAYNWLRYPEEEKSLSPNVRNSVHIILGRDDKGEVKYFPRIGALGDFLSWFGLDAAPGMVSDLLNKRKTLKDIALEMAKAPVNQIVQGLAPIPKALFEYAGRKEFFPDAFNPRTIRDRGIYLAKQLDLDEEYKLIAGKPHEPYRERLESLFVYKSNPDEAAYHEINDLKGEFLKKFGKSGGTANITPRGNALYNMKLAHRYGNTKTEQKYLQEYVRYHLLEAGYTGKDTKEFLKSLNRGLVQTMKNMHPLAGLSQAEINPFLTTLKPGDWQTLARAVRFYNDTLIGTSSVTEEEIKDWTKK